jgi:hypothetical protein
MIGSEASPGERRLPSGFNDVRDMPNNDQVLLEGRLSNRQETAVLIWKMPAQVRMPGAVGGSSKKDSFYSMVPIANL